MKRREREREKHSKYKIKDFNCLIEMWPIYGSYFSSSLELSNNKKTSLIVFADTWMSSLKC